MVAILETEGKEGIDAASSGEVEALTASEWRAMSEFEQSDYLMHFRLAYRADSQVNWCPTLGTVLANDEIKDGFSERGGHSVEKRTMKQWMLRITAYADRLLGNLDNLLWPEHLKEMQRNWIGKSVGCEVDFPISQHDTQEPVRIYTTRPDTLFGCTFLVLAPEHERVESLTSNIQHEVVNDYIRSVQKRSERQRQAEVSYVSGVFLGTYAVHPLTQTKIPIWIADYVLPEYGTGAIMAVPSSDERDFRFATKFDLPVRHVFKGTEELRNPYEVNHGELINSDILNGLDDVIARQRIIQHVEEIAGGSDSVKFRMRDAIFGRQRYWGEPIPIYYDEHGVAKAVDEDDLPLVLPEIDKYLPTKDGEPPLARAENWQYRGMDLETTTMPGWAGSSWYFLRYMDSDNSEAFADPQRLAYWKSVDCYVGGSEHATGHLLYSRFWTFFLHDIGLTNIQEPFRKVICQGMILGRSALVHRLRNSNTFVSSDIAEAYDTHTIYIDAGFVDGNDAVDTEHLMNWRKEFYSAEFVRNRAGQFLCSRIVEKMSKSKYNVVVPDSLIEKYGADCFRIHEMFLGPIDQPVPWSIQTIEGSMRFLKRVWHLFYDDEGTLLVNGTPPDENTRRLLHRTIKEVSEKTEAMLYNTAIASMMNCVNNFTKAGIHNKELLSILIQLLHPYAPFITEELWCKALGRTPSILDGGYPAWDESYLTETEVLYIISVNGKVRDKILLPSDIDKKAAVMATLSLPQIKKWTENGAVRKVILKQNKIINFLI